MFNPVFLAELSTQNSLGETSAKDREREGSPSLRKYDLSAPGDKDHRLLLYPTVGKRAGGAMWVKDRNGKQPEPPAGWNAIESSSVLKEWLQM